MFTMKESTVRTVLYLTFLTAAVAGQSDCGRPEVRGQDVDDEGAERIVGGSYATKGAWPWQVLMKYNGNVACGGSVLDPRHVLTAAHCFQPQFSMSKFKVYAGTSSISLDSSVQVSTIAKVTQHPGYSPYRGFNYDMAVIKLTTPLKLNKYVKTICLPQYGGQPAGGTKCVVTGFGETKDNWYDGRLKQTTVPIVSHATCRYAWPGQITQNNFCAGERSSTNRPCSGDSGGPLVCKSAATGRWVQYGTVSFGDKFCRDPNRYGVYGSVATLRPFIDKQLN